MLRWYRAGIILGLIVLSAGLLWFGHIGQEGGAGSWNATAASIAAWTGALTGYGAISRWRSEGTLRGLLLTPASPLTLTSAFMLSGLIVGIAIIVLTLIAGSALGDVAPTYRTIRQILVLAIGNLGFLSYSLALSTVLTRDVAAVVAIGGLLLGSGPPGHWSQLGLPLALSVPLDAILRVVPTTFRLRQAMEAPSVGTGLLVLGLLALTGVAASALAMTRTSNLRPPRAEGF